MKRLLGFGKVIKSAAILLATAVFALQTALPVGATNLLDLLNQGVDYYIPGDTCGSTGTDIPADSSLPADILAAATKNKTIYEAAAKQVDLPWQVLAGIHYRESNFNTTHDLQAGNLLGAGGPQASTSYAKYGIPKTIEESVLIAGKELQDKAQAGIFHKKITMASIDTELIKDALFGYNGRAQVYAQQAAQLGFDPVKQPYEGSPYVMSRYDALHTNMKIITQDFGGLDGIDKRFGAFTIYSMLGGPTNGSGTITSTCQGANPAVGTASFYDLIHRYAWPTYSRPVFLKKLGDDTNPKSGYAKANIDAKARGEYVGGCDGVDCGAFVMRVMRDSGIDPHYNDPPKGGYPDGGGTIDQWAYMRNHPDLYQHLTNVNDSTGTHNLQPGDIAVNSHHTYLYVGPVPDIPGVAHFNGNSASASLCERAPMASNAYGFSSFQWFRNIKPANGTGAITPVTGP
jgi:hypothetical protein